MHPSRSADTPPPEVSQQEENRSSQMFIEVHDEPLSEPPQHIPLVSEALTSPNGNTMSQESSNALAASAGTCIKRSVPWKGRNVVISIPHGHFHSIGYMQPLSAEDAQSRLRALELSGHHVGGFDLCQNTDEQAGASQVRPVFPDEIETRTQPGNNMVRVHIPNPRQWADYVAWLTEQKLQALGVSTGLEEVPSATSSMARQLSGPYPVLPFSPPILTSSAQSIGRSAMMRSQHMHHASMASPISPLYGPFGHSRAQSTITSPFGFPGPQPPQLAQHLPHQQQQPLRGGMQPVSHAQYFNAGGVVRGSPPTQTAATRLDVGLVRSSASPLRQLVTSLTPQDHSGGLVEDQRRRQHVHSLSMQPSISGGITSPPNTRPTPLLPELLEDENEGKQPAEKYCIPLPKKGHVNTHIAVPTPRGHRHNISEGLEREIRAAEDKLDRSANCDEEKASAARFAINKAQSEATGKYLTNDQLTLNERRPKVSVAASAPGMALYQQMNGHMKSVSRFNVAAPAFEFHPGASFKPTAPMLTFGGPNAKPVAALPVRGLQDLNTQQTSSESFNAATPAFQPSPSFAALSEGKFSFLSDGPSFNPNMPGFPPQPAAQQTVVDTLYSSSGKFIIPDIIKPAKKSNAVAIVRPGKAAMESSKVYSYQEDEDGRPMQNENRQKRMFSRGNDGDEVPRFAEPAPESDAVMPSRSSGPNKSQTDLGTKHQAPENVDSNDPGQGSLEGGEVDESFEQSENNTATTEMAPETEGDNDVSNSISPIESEVSRQSSRRQKHNLTSSLSALAKPFDFKVADMPENDDSSKRTRHIDLSDGDENEAPAQPLLREHPVQSRDSSTALRPSEDGSFLTALEPYRYLEYQTTGLRDNGHQPEPSFDEIDAVMNLLNQEGPVLTADENIQPVDWSSPRSQSVRKAFSPPKSERSNVSSPNSSRRHILHQIEVDSPFSANENSEPKFTLGSRWPDIRQLNKAEDVVPSDWSGMLSPVDEDRLQQRSQFFDSHIDKVVGSVMEKRLQPLEDALRLIQKTVSDAASREQRPILKLGTSAIDSDADDEDDEDDEVLPPRPVSQGREKRHDMVKTAVLEALKEQDFTPLLGRSVHDIEEIHSVLADMKVSFARATCSSLELEDIRTVVEDALRECTQAIMPITIDDRDETAESHRRQMSEVEGRLSETLAGAFEEANHRHAIEEREAETRRLLGLAEEELRLLRDTENDKDARLQALEEERHDLHERLEGAIEAMRDTEYRKKALEAENEAMQGTLEEYRASSTKWRHDIDEAKSERESMEVTSNKLRRQLEDGQESRERMHARLEKLHADLATAAGQLASEKVSWKARDEDQQARITKMETQLTAEARLRSELEEELRALRSRASDVIEANSIVEHARSAKATLRETVQTLQTDFGEQQAITDQFERDSHEAREDGRAEVQGRRVSMGTDVGATANQVNTVRAELESEAGRMRSEVGNVKTEAYTTKPCHGLLLEGKSDARREALREVTHANSVAIDEARQMYELALKEIQGQHKRALDNALEDKQRSEFFLNERLSLSDSKLDHFQDKVLHLEEKLSVAKTAAQAAAISAQSNRAAPPVTTTSANAGKVSPQALRESILVLQEQLQERESRIERLHAEVASHDKEASTKLKERDMEIQWLRELLSVRNEDLSELINTLSQPTYDRDAVRDFAIRIRTNLQMEQQEKERLLTSSQSLPGQALTSLSNFASPKAVQLAAAIGNWRRSIESTSRERSQIQSRPSRSYTPSKHPSSASVPGFLSGLMTPPASNIQRTPSPHGATSIAPPRLTSHKPSRPASISASQARPTLDGKQSGIVPPTPSTPTLLQDQNYDRDAEDSNANMLGIYDEEDSLSIANAGEPQSLEADLRPMSS